MNTYNDYLILKKDFDNIHIFKFDQKKGFVEIDVGKIVGHFACVNKGILYVYDNNKKCLITFSLKTLKTIGV